MRVEELRRRAGRPAARKSSADVVKKAASTQPSGSGGPRPAVVSELGRIIGKVRD
jgi:hypothetical protein